MTVQRVAGLTALGSGILLAITLVLSAVAGSAAFAPNAWQMPTGMMGPGHMADGVAGMGHGMMGFGSSVTAPSAIPGAPEVKIEASNFSFAPKEIRLPKTGAVNVTLINPTATGVVHDLTVPALGIHVVAAAGRSATIGLSGLAAGRYEAFCGVPGHADLGMRATVVVE